MLLLVSPRQGSFFSAPNSLGACTPIRSTRRIEATRLPERETVTDFSLGVPLATVQKLARYWATEYDWRKVEARLNAVPNFITEIDGLDIDFIPLSSPF
jgi:hypothetical protein